MRKGGGQIAKGGEDVPAADERNANEIDVKRELLEIRSARCVKSED